MSAEIYFITKTRKRIKNKIAKRSLINIPTNEPKSPPPAALIAFRKLPKFTSSEIAIPKNSPMMLPKGGKKIIPTIKPKRPKIIEFLPAPPILAPQSPEAKSMISASRAIAPRMIKSVAFKC